MSLESSDYKELKKSFEQSLISIFSSSEIQLIWRESLIYFIGISAIQQMTASHRIFSDSECKLLSDVVKRLKKGEPFQYIIGEVEFYGIELKIDGRALIPRPETEELVDWISQSHKDDVKNILDICSGSGCIALALSSTFQKANVCGVEYSKLAIDLAQENALALKLPTNFIEVDVLDENAFKTLLNKQVQDKKPFDVVVSNPPYIPNQEKSLMASHVIDHEPELALFVPDQDPLLFYRVISKAVMPFLSTNGALFFECHYSYVDQTRDMLLEMGYQNVEKRRDLQGKWRMLKAQKS